MKFQLLVLGCVLQSIYGFNIDDFIMYPPALTSSRIRGGEDAPEGFAPYQCSMQVDGRHFCGCSIISKKWILTASHCVVGQSTENLEILVGTNTLNEGGTYYKTEKLITHENYNKPNFANDIAVIKLVDEIEFNDRVKPIELEENELEEGVELTLTGWGRLRAGGESPQKLQMIKLEGISTKKCSEIYKGRNVHESHLCTVSPVGEGACNGDSGGPLVLRSRNSLKVVGVVNFGVPCGMGYPDAFAKVSYMLDWIKEHTK